MSIQFQPLPLDIFTEAQRPHIARLNAKLRELCALEGTLRNPLSTKRSDNTIARRDTEQVHVTRITPDIMNVVSGVSSVVATPNLTLGQTNAVGTTTGVVSVNSSIALFGTQTPTALAATAATGTSAFAARGDHVHLFPTTLRSTANASTIVLTDDGSEQTLTGSLGNIKISSPLSVIVDARSGAASTALTIQLDPDSGNLTGIAPSWFGGAVSSATLSCWDAQFSGFAGVFTTAKFIGYRASVFSFTPSATSDNANSAYTIDITGPVINNATGGWTEVAGLNISGPRRSLANPTVTLAATAILECPTISGTSQIGVWVKQRTAQQTATNRYGIFVEAQNSGTNRYAFYGVSDILYHAGNIQHAGSRIGLYGVGSGATQSAGWSVSNITATKTLNGSSFSLNDVMNAFGTLLIYMQARGDIAP